ncbi:MAG: transaldolase, partial [Rubrobacter sp.]|nr:transaldolase [Rubrobacter sp.]
MNENLQKAAELGQGIWIDSISRDDLVEGGALHRMIEDGVVGVTSNPSIFQKAISESELYDEQLEEASRETDDPKELFWKLAVRDIQDACDILAPVYERTATKDGYVSLEVSPDIGYDAPKTVDEALMLHDLIDRPNLLVKIPATQPGLAAIEEVIRNGKSVNVTLIFSLDRYKAVARAYIRGLQRLVAEGGDPSGVASVASFFVSRVDSEGDKRLEEAGRPDLRGRLAIANAKLAYAAFEEIFSG